MGNRVQLTRAASTEASAETAVSSAFIRRLNHPVAAGVISIAAWLGFVLARWQVWAQGHISLFIMSGVKDYSHPSQMVPHISHVPSQGYDGQFYYRFARNPFNWNPTAYGITIDHNYRYTRIGYSLIAWILSGGGHARLLPTVLVVINLICVGLMAYLGAKLAQESGRHALWGLAFVVYMGLVISLGRNTSEPLADACMLAGILAYRHRRYIWAALLIAYAVFTNEPILILAVAFALVRLYQIWKKRVKPGLPDLVWVLPGAVYVLLEIAEKIVVKGKSGGVSDFTSNLTLPFKALVPGVVRDIADSSWSHLGLYDYNVLDFIGLAVIVVAGLLVIRAARVSLEEKAAFVGFVLVEIVLASGQFWDSTFGEGRTYIDAFLLGVLMLLATPAGAVSRAAGTVGGAVSDAAGAVSETVSGAAEAAADAVTDAAAKARTTISSRTLVVLDRVFSTDWVMTNKRLGWLMVIPVIVLVVVARRHILHQ
jgi:hypothetical protein